MAAISRTALRRLVVPLAAASLLLVSACADDADGAGDPMTGGGFAPSALEDVPAPEDSRPIGGATTEGGTSTQSFTVGGAWPQEAINDYEETAKNAGWTTTAEPAQTGTSDWSLTMVKDGSTLLVTTAPDGNSVQLTIELS